MDILILILVCMVIYYLIKHITSGIVMGLTISLSLLVVYIVLTRVMYIEIPGDIKLPQLFKDVDTHIEEIEDKKNKYEYRYIDR